MGVLLGVCAHMDVVVDFVPEQFSCAAKNVIGTGRHYLRLETNRVRAE